MIYTERNKFAVAWNYGTMVLRNYGTMELWNYANKETADSINEVMVCRLVMYANP